MLEFKFINIGLLAISSNRVEAVFPAAISSLNLVQYTPGLR